MGVSVRASSDGDIVPLPVASIRARSRPWAVIAVWAWESALSLLGAVPAVALVRATYGRHPQGDAPLWDPGALPLLGLLSRETNGVRAATTSAAFVLLLASVVGLVPMAALMISMATATRDGRAIGGPRAVDGALRALRPLALLLAILWLAQGVVVAIALLLGEGTQSLANRSVGDALAQQMAIGLGAVVLAVAVAIGLVHDLARAAMIRFGLGTMSALVAGTTALWRAPVAVSWSWLWRALASVVPIAAVSLLADRIGGRSGLALVVLAVLHQSVILSRVALRSSWLAKAMRTVRDVGRIGYGEVDGADPSELDRPTGPGRYLEASDR
jgi:hypothetical protein